MPKRELYGSASCPFTADMRDWLELSGRDFVEYDVERDAAAQARLKSVSGQRLVPVLVEDGKVIEIGWRGRGCVI
jgi:glutaredoxin